MTDAITPESFPAALRRAGVPLCLLDSGLVAAVIRSPNAGFDRHPAVVLADVLGRPFGRGYRLGYDGAVALGMSDADARCVCAAVFGSAWAMPPRAAAVRAELVRLATTAEGVPCSRP